MTSFSCFQRYDELGVIPNFSVGDRFFNVQENSFGVVCIMHMYDSGLFCEPRTLSFALLLNYFVLSKKTLKIFRENIMSLKNQHKYVGDFFFTRFFCIQ